MPTSTTVNPVDPFALLAKAEWEDPAITLERDLEVQAQDYPPGMGLDHGFLGPLSGSNGDCG